MTDIAQEWVRSMSIAWYAGEKGEVDKSLRCYQYAQEIVEKMGLPASVDINPELSLLRHRSGQAEGIITPFPPVEDAVMAVRLPDETQETSDAFGRGTCC